MKWVAWAYLLALPLAAADIYRHVDEQGNVSYTDQPQTTGQAEAQADAAQRRDERERLGIPARKVSAAQRAAIKTRYQRAQERREELENKKAATCGEHPRGGFVGFGPKRDRYIAYEKCERSFKRALDRAAQDLQIARRNYMSVE